MKAGKASWTVVAGVIPGTPIAEFTKRWDYDSDEMEEDGRHASDPAYQPLFMKKLAEASFYAYQLNNPKLLNWVETTFLWY